MKKGFTDFFDRFRRVYMTMEMIDASIIQKRPVSRVVLIDTKGRKYVYREVYIEREALKFCGFIESEHRGVRVYYRITEKGRRFLQYARTVAGNIGELDAYNDHVRMKKRLDDEN